MPRIFSVWRTWHYNRRMWIGWKRLARVAVLLLAMGFLGAMVWRQWAVIKTYPWQIAPGWALLGLAGLELTWLFEAGTWSKVLAGLGGHLRFGRAARAWFLSNIIRYIPGNIWQFLGMVEMAAEDGVPRPATAASIAVHQVLLTATGLTLGALYFAVAGQGEWLVRLRPLLLFVPLGLFLLQPRLLQWALNWLLVRFGRQPLRITLTWRAIWWLVLRYAVVWIAEGLSFAALVRALTPAGWGAAPQLVAAWVTAYMAGYLSLLTPSGLGVREAVMVLVLGPVVPAPVAALVAIAVRLLMVLAEVLGALAILAIDSGRGRRRGRVINAPLADGSQSPEGPLPAGEGRLAHDPS
jgi:glycosyltransferase 2 family protein